MTPRDINVAIAESTGWTITQGRNAPNFPYGFPPGVGNRDFPAQAIPNFSGDLNAVRLAESRLTDEQWGDYTDWLRVLYLHRHHSPERRLAHASAELKAECILRAKGLWK